MLDFCGEFSWRGLAVECLSLNLRDLLANMSIFSPAHVACYIAGGPQEGCFDALPQYQIANGLPCTPAGKHNITCEIEKIPMDYVNTALERLVKNDVHYR